MRLNVFLALYTSASRAFGVLSNHAFLVDVRVLTVFLHAVKLRAQTKSFFLTLVQDQFIREVIDHFETHQTKLLKVKVFDALVLSELRSRVLLIATHAHHADRWTLGLYVHRQFLSSQVLELGELADVATKLGTTELAVICKLSDSSPDYFLVSILIEASVRELAVLDEVSEDFVDILQEGSLDAAVGTQHAGLFSLFGWHVQLLLQLELAVLAEQLVATLALLRFERKLKADHALDLLNHLSLEFVLDFVHLDIERRDGFSSHDVSGLFFSEHESQSLLNAEALFFSIHLFEDRWRL